MIGLFPVSRNEPSKLISALADPSSASVYIIAGEFPKDTLEFESFANQYPHTNYFECELAESYGYNPLNHPWLRPVRTQKFILGNIPYSDYKLWGDEVHEVAVGPIHAGIIEPGHFRFQCHGELVHNLEINLGYQHRGIEDLLLHADKNAMIPIAESIAGDTVIGHTYAHCSAIESLTRTSVSLRAQIIRSIAEEMERIAMHLSGLGGISNDIGLAIASASYGRLRTLMINSLAALCGSRFGRGLFVYGGVRFDFTDQVLAQIINGMKTVRKEVTEINNFLFSTTSALIRLEHTGIVLPELAQKIGMVGLAARASGIELDTRTNRPYGAYRYSPLSVLTLQEGDVFARSRLRALEIDESFNFIFDQLGNIPNGEIRTGGGEIMPDTGVISITEGWRGEIVHAVFSGDTGEIMQYKIKDPSFSNWYGLSMSLRKTAISDFPLCNKSYDLSYCGHDL
ncbi:MAG: hydrogenase [Spirochaetota bacterium]